MQRWALIPDDTGAGARLGIGRDPEIRNGDEFTARIQQRQAFAHPGHHALFLK